MSNYNFNEVNHDSAGASSSSSGGRGIVYLEEAQGHAQTPNANEHHYAASERDSSSGGEGSGMNFMAQRPSFQVQLPVSEKFADRAPYGSGDFDDGYTLEFDSIDHFMEWRAKVEEDDTVEFVKGDSHGSKADPPRFKEHVKLVCARHNRSGRKTYVKKYPERQRKVPSRKLGGEGCPAFISYKTYHNTSRVRAMYHSQHSHEIGLANLQFTRKGRKAAEEERKRQSSRGHRVTPLGTAAAPPARVITSSSSASNLRAASTQSDDVNITIDSGEPYTADGSSDFLGGYAGMTGSQHPYALPQLPVPFSPALSPLHLQEGPYQATHNQLYPSHVIPGTPLRHNSSSSNATFGSLSLTTTNLQASETQLPSAGHHTSAILSPYGPVSPSEVFATPDQLNTPYNQPQSFGVFDTPQAVQAFSALAATHASPHSSNSHSSGSSRAQSNPHSSPNPLPCSPLHPQASISQTQLNIDVLAQAQPASAHETAPHSAVEQQQQTVLIGNRLDRLLQNAQELLNCAAGFEFSKQGLDRLETAIGGLYGEMYAENNQTQGQGYATQLDAGMHSHLNTLNHDQTHDQNFIPVSSGSGYNQFLPQVDYTQAGAATQGMHLHASVTSATGLHL